MNEIIIGLGIAFIFTISFLCIPITMNVFLDMQSAAKAAKEQEKRCQKYLQKIREACKEDYMRISK